MNPKKIAIVGAETSAWMTAAYLQAALAHTVDQPHRIEVVGVPGSRPEAGAEAATLSFRHIMAALGIDEIQLLQRAGGTFRQATRYVNWLRGTGDFYYEPLDDARTQPVDRAAMDWLMSDRSIAFAETVSPQPVICDLGLAPVPLEPRPTNLSLKYSYHLDQDRLAGLLRDVAISRGAVHRQDPVVAVEKDDVGDIAALRTDAGDRLEADLYVDCSGPDALLIGEYPDSEWHDGSEWLPCDREVLIDVPYSQYYPGRVAPFSSVSALSSGWVRELPLQNRRTLGYVHASRHIDEDAALRELRAFEGRHAASLETRSSNFRTGYRSAPWSRNCVGIDTAAACVEPLPSASNCFRDLGIMALAEYFPFGDDFGPFAYRYNRVMTNRFHEVLDFINLHYALSQRTDTDFWRDAADPAHVHDRVQAKLDFWKHKLPTLSDFVDQHLPGQAAGPGATHGPVDTGAVFGVANYEATLFGMQYLADECDEWFGVDRPPTRVPGYIIADLKEATAMLPPQDVWLRHVTGMPDYSRSGRQ